MKTTLLSGDLLIAATLSSASAGQVPGAASDPDVAISHRDRVYSAEQFSSTVSVVDPVDNKTLGVIKLGDPSPGNFSPLYKGQVLVHGMGFSPDHHTLTVVSIGSNSVTFIDTATNAVKHTTYVGRSPHEAFFTPDGKEVWVTVRGENYIAVLDAASFEEKTRITTPAGPGMQIFSPDGKYGYICSSFNPELDVVTVADHQIVARVKQDSPFCPNIAATPDGRRWCTSGTKRKMTRAPKRYAITRRQRTDSGRPAASIRFRTATPMAASVCWAAKPRARRRGPISALKRPIVVSTSDRCP